MLNVALAAAYPPFQSLESKQLMYDLLENAGGVGVDVQGPFQRAVASIIHTLLYGFCVKDYNNPVLRAVVRLNDQFSEPVKVGEHIVDILNNLPGFFAPWKAKAENHYMTKYDLRDKNFRTGLDSDAGNISKQLKKTLGKDDLTMPLHELAFELDTLIDAALDGTTGSLIWFVVACIT